MFLLATKKGSIIFSDFFMDQIPCKYSGIYEKEVYPQ